MIVFYFTDLPGLAVSTQVEMARAAGYTDTSASWTDTAKSFPVEREKLFRSLRAADKDQVWVAALPVIAKNRKDLRHAVLTLETANASILEGFSGWELKPPYDQGLAVANCYEVWGKRRKLLDDPRGDGKAARNGAKPEKMPEALARPIWFDPTIPTEREALEKMNSDPRWRGEWKGRTAHANFGAHGRPPGARPGSRKSPQPETNE